MKKLLIALVLVGGIYAAVPQTAAAQYPSQCTAAQIVEVGHQQRYLTWAAYEYDYAYIEYANTAGAEAMLSAAFWCDPLGAGWYVEAGAFIWASTNTYDGYEYFNVIAGLVWFYFLNA